MNKEEAVEICEKFNNINILYGKLTLTDKQFTDLKTAIDIILQQASLVDTLKEKLKSDIEIAKKHYTENVKTATMKKLQENSIINLGIRIRENILKDLESDKL